ncbi:hypothetical protein C0Q70_20009 [Pomacea canaliculata]|uniref:Uncharacterized protein n=1 Tax=Pomacea canaliculata TaxID=400727 RepID=A0A2T7NEB9_POMCA|nr:hypothetical protein C0Q70_20009 [Pomacea canaliculata]
MLPFHSATTTTIITTITSLRGKTAAAGLFVEVGGGKGHPKTTARKNQVASANNRRQGLKLEPMEISYPAPPLGNHRSPYLPPHLLSRTRHYFSHMVERSESHVVAPVCCPTAGKTTLPSWAVAQPPLLLYFQTKTHNLQRWLFEDCLKKTSRLSSLLPSGPFDRICRVVFALVNGRLRLGCPPTHPCRQRFKALHTDDDTSRTLISQGLGMSVPPVRLVKHTPHHASLQRSIERHCDELTLEAQSGLWGC